MKLRCNGWDSGGCIWPAAERWISPISRISLSRFWTGSGLKAGRNRYHPEMMDPSEWATGSLPTHFWKRHSRELGGIGNATTERSSCRTKMCNPKGVPDRCRMPFRPTSHPLRSNPRKNGEWLI